VTRITEVGYGCNVKRTNYVGTAGWSLPREEQHRFPADGSHLQRYARVFDAVEINSTFHRPHRPATFKRWAQSVPRGFLFSVKLPRAITHDARLSHAGALVETFIADLKPLGARMACLLAQLPPSLEFEERVAASFFRALRRRYRGAIAIEPRHASWFTPECEAQLIKHEVARVAADPPRGPGGNEPGGWNGFSYFRLHGTPRVYYSSYDERFLETLASAVRRAPKPCWVIFDNTTLGAGTGNALSLLQLLR
jgi:uncharacterized protein YecE (DUF72 family)